MAGNTFGQLFTVTSFGESHGPALGCVVDGCPPGLELAEDDIQRDVERRRSGTSRYTSQRREPDAVRILSGVFEGRTTGTPIGLLVTNEDQRSYDYEKIKDRFRPGHADYTYQHKYGFRDYRGGGRSSARETVMRVAAGAIARKYLAERLGVRIYGYLAQMGDDPARAARPRGGRPQSVLLPGSGACRRPRGADRPAAARRRLDRRARHGRGDGRAARARRARVRPARRRPRARDDGHQCGQGGRGGRRIPRRRAARIGAPRRAHAGGFPVESRRRHARRHLLRPGRRGEHGAQADLEHRDPGPHRSTWPGSQSRSAPPAATTRASESGRCRSPRPCWPWC